jgi:replicative DNA helicase
MTHNGTHPQRTRRDEPTGAGADAFAKLYARPLPYALEAEMALLGSLMLDPRVLPDVVAIIPGPEAFYDEQHGVLWSALLAMYDTDPAADLVSLLARLGADGRLDDVGGPEYIGKLAEEVPSAAGAQRYARIVADRYQRRQLIEVGDQIIFASMTAGELEDTEALIDAAEARVLSVRREADTGAGKAESLADLLQQEVERLNHGAGATLAIPTGFYDLDKITAGGLHLGEMTVLAARPSMGKTALALNLAEQIARGGVSPDLAERGSVPVGIFSMEMGKAAIVQRMLSAFSGVDSQRMREGKLSASDLASTTGHADQLATVPILIDDTPALSVLNLRTRARRMVAQHGVRVILIDYMQLMNATVSRGDNRQVEVSAISSGIKALARELNVPVVVLSQLNRASEQREGNRPRMSDLRESGSIEQDADVVLLLHREDYYHASDQDWAENNPDRVGVADLIIAKQRNGPTGMVSLGWDARTTRFRNHAAYERAGAPVETRQGSLIDQGAGW